MEDHGGDYGETSNGGAGHDEFEGLGTTEYDRQQVRTALQFIIWEGSTRRRSSSGAEG